MTQGEKQALLDLFAEESRWCRDHEARTAEGNPTSFDADDAIAWDLTGACCHLFGWDRACALFGQIARHIHGKQTPVLLSRETDIDAMVSLQTFNDRPETSFSDVRQRIDTMPIWSSGSRSNSGVES